MSRSGNRSRALFQQALAIVCPDCAAKVNKRCVGDVTCSGRIELALKIGVGPAASAVQPARSAKWDGVNAARARNADPGGLNGPERAYLRELERLKQAGEVREYQAHPLGLRLGRGCFYHPDFLVVLTSGLICLDEVKGARGWELDSESRTKWIAAGERNQWACFRVARQVKGEWVVEAYRPKGPWLPNGGLS